MKPALLMLILIIGWFLTACGGSSSPQPEADANDLTSRQQAELVATTLSARQGGVEEDITGITRAATGHLEQQTLARTASYGYTISVDIDFYDEQGDLQQIYDPHTTDRIDYHSQIQGRITNGTGYFRELNVDNQSDFSVEDILSRFVWINGRHTNHSSYSRTQELTQAEVDYQLDSELILSDVALDLDANDTFPESGTIEGTVSGSYERVATAWEKTSRFEFHFVASFMGDNTAEVELGDGTTFIVRLDSGDVLFPE